MMRLCDALASLDRFGSDTTIYSAEPWAADSRTVVAVDGDPAARAAIASGMSHMPEPTVAERCEAVIHCAVFDSYLEAS
jgi:hypothetical protein